MVFNFGQQIGQRFGEFASMETPEAFNQNPDLLVGLLDHLLNPGKTTARIKIFGGRIIYRCGLQNQTNQAITRNHIIDQLITRNGLDQERSNHTREDDNVCQSKDR